MTRYSNDSLKLHALGMASAKTFRCLQNLSHNLNLATIGPETGAPYREVRFTGSQKPEINTSICALDSLLGFAPLLTPFCIAADGGHPGVVGFMEAHDACGTDGRSSGSTHMSVTSQLAKMIITRLEGRTGQSAWATVRIICLSVDPEDRPTVVVFNAALPTGLILDEEFTIDAPTIAGINIAPDHISGWQLDTGQDVDVIIGAGSLRPTAIDWKKSSPKFTINHDDPSLLDDAKIPYEGIVCAHADTKFPLIRRDPFDGLVDRSETEHMKLTAAGMAYFSKHYDASGSATGSGEITIECTQPSGSVPVVVTRGIALS